MDKMSQDQKLHDPDYEEVTSEPKKNLNVLTQEHKIEKIRTIVNKEFSAEIQRKERDIDIIDERLNLAKKTLHRLRYAIVKSYYDSKQFELTQEDIQKEIIQQKEPIARTKVHSMLKNEQKRIHPAIKKLLGPKADVDLNEIFKIRPPRKRSKKETTPAPSTSLNISIPSEDNSDLMQHLIKDEIKTETDEINSKLSIKYEDQKVPRYIEPKNMDKNVLKIDTAIRNKQKEKFRIIIGNTSKYTSSHSEMDPLTHRWLLYVRGPRESPDISHFVQSVTVKLDDSYAPHNIIQLKSIPFHLLRRGWGEFPVNLRIHFKNESLNKPVNIVHHLKLDRNYTGLQTLGAETVVDVWLYCDESMLEKKVATTEPCVPPSDNTNQANVGISNPPQTHDSPACYNTRKHNTPLHQQDSGILEINETKPENYNNLFIKQEIVDEDYSEMHSSNIFPDIKTEPMDIDEINNTDQAVCSKPMELNGLSSLSTISTKIKLEYPNKPISKVVQSFSNQIILGDPGKKKISLLKVNPNSLLKSNVCNIMNSSENKKKEQFTSNLLYCIDNINAFNNDHAYVEKKYMPCPNVQKSILNLNFKSIVLGKKQLEGISNQNNLKFLTGSLLDNVGCRIPNKVIIGKNDTLIQKEKEESTRHADTVWACIIESIKKMNNVRAIVSLMLKKMPLVHEMSENLEFQKAFPFAVKSEENFYNLHVVKRRYLEWSRAKMINSFLRDYFKKSPEVFKFHRIWSVKQIIMFSHYHGYYPVRGTNTDTEHSILNNLSMTYKDKIELKEIFDNSYEINSLTNINDFENEKSKINNSIKKEPINKYFDRDKTSKNWDERQLDLKNEVIDEIEISENSEEEIDLLNDTKDDKKGLKKRSKNKGPLVRENVLPFANEDEKLQCFYIEKICAQQGIELRNEDVGNGCTHSLVHKVILSAVSSLVEDILRRSLAVKMSAMDEKDTAYDAINRNKPNCKMKRPLWKRTESGDAYSVSLRHIYEGLHTRSELEVLTNYGLGTKEMDYSGNL